MKFVNIAAPAVLFISWKAAAQPDLSASTAARISAAIVARLDSRAAPTGPDIRADYGPVLVGWVAVQPASQSISSAPCCQIVIAASTPNSSTAQARAAMRPAVIRIGAASIRRLTMISRAE